MPRLRRLGNIAEVLLKQHLAGQEAEQQQERSFQQQDRARKSSLTDKLTEGAINNPEASDQLFELAKQMGVQIPEAARASNDDLLKKTRASISPTTSDTDITNQVSTLGRGLADPEGVLPTSMGEGPSNAPGKTIQDLMALRAERAATRDAETKRTLGIEGDKAKATSYGTASGAEQAAAENAPAKLERDMNTFRSMTPLEATRAGMTTGASAQATESVQNNPANVAGAANRAGAISGAQARAQTPELLMRERALEDVRQQNRIELEQLKLKEPTSQTRSMMEGAKMISPHIDSVAQQAKALNDAGLFGPFMSRVREIAAKAGTIDEFEGAMAQLGGSSPDKAIGRFATDLGLTASGIARVHGGARGGGNAMMLGYMKALLSDAGSLPMFEGRMEGAKEFMDAYARGPNNIQPDSQPSPAGNPTIPLTPTLQKRLQ